MEDLTDPRGRGLDKASLRRGWLLVLVIMLAFIALTKIFPSAPSSPQAPAQLTDVQAQDGAKPSH